jgi:phage tail sheath protein FI
MSPGVKWKEIDLSHYTPALSSTTIGCVGTATKGPINKRVLIGNLEQLVQVFGYPSLPHYGLYAAKEYLREGNQLWFVRVEGEEDPAKVAKASVALVDGTTVDWSAKDAGTYYNGMIVKIQHSNALNTSETKLGSDSATGAFTFTLTGPVAPKSVKILLDGAIVGTDDGAGVITGTGLTGTVNYATGAVTASFADAPTAAQVVKGLGMYYTTFNVELYKVIGAKSYRVESFQNLSLNALVENYYKNTMKNSVTLAVPELTTAMPAVGSYVLAGGDDGLASITDGDYIGTVIGDTATGLQAFVNPESVDVNTVVCPGVSSQPVVQALLTLAETRRDCMVIPDPPSGLEVEGVIDWINGAGDYALQNSINSSYAAVYYPWVKVYDEFNEKEVLVPPSGFAIAAFARTDAQADIFYAPAGGKRGKALGALGTERTLNEGQRTLLYINRINPVSDFIASGILIWGQKTAQVEASDVDRVAARRTLLYIEKVIVTALQPLVFEPNNKYTWARAEAIVQPFLDGYVSKGGLYYGKVVCNGDTNTPDVIQRNEMVVNVFLKLPKSAEFITVNFILLATGANVEEYLGRQF